MKIEKYEIGEIITDTLAKDKCIVRSIESGTVKLSRVDKPESFYYQIDRYLKNN